MTEWTIGAVLDEIAQAVPDRVMTVCGDRRSTFAESAERTDAPELAGAVPLDDALVHGSAGSAPTGSPDDLLMICTGGTTGRPKAVLWRQSDIYVSSMVGADHASADEIHQLLRCAGLATARPTIGGRKVK